MRIICVAGARPNFMKIAPLIAEFNNHSEIEVFLVHTGQHYDEKMSDLFFRELGIPTPDENLGVGSGSHAVQTAEVMKAFEPICLKYKPDYVLVVGDVNGTVACGLVAVKLGIKLIHVEAGLRSGDRTMPEEINRIVVDSISDLLFCSEPSGVVNLQREGVDDSRVYFVGNVMIDSLVANLEKADRLPVLEQMGLTPRKYATMTLHRPSNVDVKEVFSGLLDAIDEIQKEIPIIFPIHPRTRNNIKKMGLEARVSKASNLRLVEPQGYLEFLKLNSNARLVITDSGGLQEETTFLKVPCLTLRENTERPVTCEIGTNRLVGVDPNVILKAYREIINNENVDSGIPDKWDGRTSQRIAEILIKRN